MSTIKKIRGVTSDTKDKKLILVLESLDKDHDGKIDDLNDVLKVKFTQLCSVLISCVKKLFLFFFLFLSRDN